MPFLVGAFLALAVGGLLGTGVGLDRDRAFYPTVDRLIVNPGVPAWWPAFCLAYDGVAATYLAFLLLRPRREHGV